MYPATPNPKDTPKTDKVWEDNCEDMKDLVYSLRDPCEELEYEAALYKWKYEELADRT